MWNDPLQWSFTEGGLGEAGQPQGGHVAFLTQTGSVDKTITYSSSLPDTTVLSSLTIDASGTGKVKLLQPGDDLKSYTANIGQKGQGEMEQNGNSSARFNYLYLGNEAGGNGSYTLHEPASLLVWTIESIGWAGTGIFTHTGGTHTNYGSLTVGFPVGTGTYALQNGTLTARFEFIGSRRGIATFTQTGGVNSVKNKSGEPGLLEIAVSTEQEIYLGLLPYKGTYEMKGGTLNALSIENKDKFKFSGGNISADFTNSGILQVDGQQIITGNYVQSTTGQLAIDITRSKDDPAIITVDRLSITGTATLGGSVNVSLDFDPNIDDNFDIFTANGIQGFNVGLFKLPLLTGVKVFRPSLISNTTLNLAVVSADVVTDVGNGIDCSDLSFVKTRLGKRSNQFVADDAKADINGDLVIDVRDLSIITRKLPAGTACP